MMNKFFKKVAIAVAAATIALTGAAVSVSANDGMGIDAMTSSVTVQDIAAVKYVASEVGANVRTAPTTDARVIKTLGYNAEVKVTGKTSNGWYQIITSDPVYGGEGSYYVYGELLSGSRQAQPAAGTSYQNYMDNHYASDAATMSHMAHCYERVNVSNGYLALRTQPTYAAENEIEQLYNGEMVQIVGETSGSYVYVCTESGNFGWVNAGFLG